MNTQNLFKQAQVLLLVVICFTASAACDPKSDDKTPDANNRDGSGSAQVEPRATPTPVVRDASKRPVYQPPPFNIPIHVWATQASVTLVDHPEAEPVELELGVRMIATGLEGEAVDVVLPDGRRGRVLFCLTDLGPAVAGKTAQAAVLPAALRNAASANYFRCLSALTENTQVGLVLQGPVKLSASPEQAPAPDAPQVESWQQLAIEADPEVPPTWARVSLNPETSGYISRHHLALGAESAWKIFKSPAGLVIANTLPTTPERADFWMIDLGLTRFIPMAIGATADQKEVSNEGWIEGPRLLDTMAWSPPPERYTWSMDAVWRQSEGVWMPEADLAAPSCERLPTRLAIKPGQLMLTRGTAITQRMDISKAEPQPNGTALLWDKEITDQPVAILYWVANREDQLALWWLYQPDPAFPAPELWVRLDEKSAASQEDKARKSLRCEALEGKK
jgi:hypothetical protein